jgi:hypothetical protein
MSTVVEGNAGGVGSRRLGRDVAVVLPAVLAHPSIWWAGLAAVARLRAGRIGTSDW